MKYNIELIDIEQISIGTCDVVDDCVFIVKWPDGIMGVNVKFLHNAHFSFDFGLTHDFFSLLSNYEI